MGPLSPCMPPSPEAAGAALVALVGAVGGATSLHGARAPPWAAVDALGGPRGAPDCLMGPGGAVVHAHVWAYGAPHAPHVGRTEYLRVMGV